MPRRQGSKIIVLIFNIMKMKRMNEVHRSLLETSRSNVEWIWSTTVKTLQSANIEDLVAGYHTVRSLRPQLQGQ